MATEVRLGSGGREPILLVLIRGLGCSNGRRGYGRFAEQMAVYCTVSPSNRGHCNGEGVPQKLGSPAASFTARPVNSLAGAPVLG